MGFYIFVTNNKLNGSSELDNSRFATEDNFQVEVTEEVYNNYNEHPNMYIYQDDDVIPNPNYEHEEEMKAIQQRVAELKEQLDQLDLKSIRAIRANDTEYIAQYEAQAEELRQQIRELENA